jgi:hypothetical protein
MRKTIFTALVVAASAAFIGNTSATTTDPTPTGSRCIDVKPICEPGKHPICICESDISLNCKWICASPGAQ